MRFFRSRRGTLSLFVVWFISAVLIVVLAGLVVPIGIEINTKFFQAGDAAIGRANLTLQEISNDSIRVQLEDVFTTARGATAENISVLGDIYQYAWVIALVLSLAIVFLSARMLVETRGGGGIIV